MKEPETALWAIVLCLIGEVPHCEREKGVHEAREDFRFIPVMRGTLGEKLQVLCLSTIHRRSTESFDVSAHVMQCEEAVVTLLPLPKLFALFERPWKRRTGGKDMTEHVDKEASTCQHEPLGRTRELGLGERLEVSAYEVTIGSDDLVQHFFHLPEETRGKVR